jgi:MraZ protein
MFIGEHSLSMDAKGRIAVPVKFRSLLAGSLVVTRGLDKSLFVYTKDEWNKLAKKLSQLPLTTANSRAFARLMLAGAWEAEIDKQGRVMIPEYLRKFATLSKKVVMAGLFNRIELWDKESWETYKKSTERESTSIAEALGELGV